jgi:hypothetical protein
MGGWRTMHSRPASRFARFLAASMAAVAMSPKAMSLSAALGLPKTSL